jgi:hypothetical protein
MNPTLLTGALATPGVLPARRRVEVHGDMVLGVPRIPAPHVAAGGFAAVVEVSASHCLRVWKEQVPPLRMVARFAPDELRALRDAQPFESATLNGVELPDPSTGLRLALSVELVPQELVFASAQGAPRRVCVRYAGTLALFTEQVEPELPPEDAFEPGFELPGPGPFVLPPPRARDVRGGREVAARSSGERRARRYAVAATAVPRRRAARRGRELVEDQPELPLGKLADAGKVTLEICCDYELTLDAPRVRADVHANLATATFAFAAAGADAQRLYPPYLKPLEPATAATAGSRVKLVPTICPAGRSPSNEIVTELPDVRAVASHVGTAPLQALVVAFDLKPGCEGTAADVQHFIAGADFGIVADEFVLDRVLRFKWRLGGFVRSLPLAQTIQVQRGDTVEDATLRGQLSVDGLDQVSIETDSNTRTDYVRLGGPATARASDVLLRDGTVLSPAEVTGAAPKPTRWTVFTGLDTAPSYVSDPLLREFARRAREDAVIHLTRPFTHPSAVPEITSSHAAVAGVTRHVIALGLIHDAFV